MERSSSSMSLQPQPEELARRISEIDLTNLRRRAGTENVPPLGLTQNDTQQSSRYSQDKALEMKQPASNESALSELRSTDKPGLETPGFPSPPPSTPAEDELSQEDIPKPTSAVEAPKKKKKSKSKSSGKKKKATGFEEFYADTPVTPEEHHEESDLYAPSRPLYVRVETCIQRYRKRRNFDEFRSNVLTKYWQLGGLEASNTKQFTGGLSRETLEQSSAQELADITATDFIRSGNAKYYDPAKPEDWVVDFQGVVKAFLSHYAEKHIRLDIELNIKQTCGIIENFLNYLLHHQVCPEYTEDILAARKICAKAQDELRCIRDLRQVLPGEFNMAASAVYGGHYKNLCSSGQDWMDYNPKRDALVTRNPTLPEAERIFKTAVAYTGNDSLFLETMKPDTRIIGSKTRSFQVVEIERATHDKVQQYNNLQDTNGRPFVKALGVIHLAHWEGPGTDEEDFTDDEEDDDSVHGQGLVIEKFWVEDDILPYFFVGLKLQLQVQELNMGVKFFDRVIGLYCSFFTVIANEKIIDNWKNPVLNTRPPPTEDNIDVEEKAMFAEFDRELEADEKNFGNQSDKKNELKDVPEEAAEN